jgi:hypothetical protein
VSGNSFVSGDSWLIPSYFLAALFLSWLFKKRVVFYQPEIKKSSSEKTKETAEK